MDTYDCIIIGAGIGGLVCGCYLAKNGMKVLILEKHSRPGGCVTSLKRCGAIFDMGAHLIGSCGRRGLFKKFMTDLDVNVDFIHLDPTDRFHFPDMVVDVPQDIDDFVALLKKIFPEEADNIMPFFKEMTKIATNFDSNDILDKYQNMSYQTFLDTYFQDPRLKGVLAAQFYYIGSTPERASALSMCLMLSSYIKDGCYYVRGGSQNLSNRLAERFTSSGGVLMLNHAVKKLIIESDIIKSAVTARNKKFYSKYFISNIDARKTMLDLIGDSNLPDDYIGRIKNYVLGSSFFLSFLIADYKKDGLEKSSGWYHSSYDLNNDKTESFYVFVSTVYNSSLNDDGLQNIELAMPISNRYANIADWKASKEKFEEDLINKASLVIPNLRQHIKYRFSATPKTIEKYTGNSNGSLYGWQMDVNQVQRYRLDNETPINNLFLAGHWTKPGCGVVSVATSGWKLARKILNINKETFVT